MIGRERRRVSVCNWLNCQCGEEWIFFEGKKTKEREGERDKVCKVFESKL